MSLQIAPIQGLIELQDDFTSRLDIAGFALQKFSKQNQESLIAVAQAAAVVTGAVIAIGAAVYNLGQRGSAVNDLRDTLEEFTGSAEASAEVMEKLRAGTRGTVDDFKLSATAAHLLSTGVKLTAEQFNTLGEASFVLAERGLGSVEENLKTVSEAMVTGRTRALAMKLGVVENDNAEEDYAKRLGVTKDQLSDRGKIEAKRIEVMRMLGEAQKSAIGIEADFADRIEKSKASVMNWVDNLASAIDKSEVFAVGMDMIGAAFSEAFSDSKGEMIETIVGWIEDLAIMVIDFAQVTISMSKIVDNAWNAVKTVVLGSATVVMGLITGLTKTIEMLAFAAEKVGVISPETLQSISDTSDLLHNMTLSLAEQTKEAAVATVTTSEYDKTMDKLNETLAKIKGSMLSAQESGKGLEEEQIVLEETTRKVAVAQEELNKGMIDGTKVQAVLAKSTAELNAMWADYYKLVMENSGTSRDVQIKDIEAVLASNIASLDKLDPLYKQKYALFQQIAHQSLENIGTDWDSVRDKSLEALQQQADAALATYQMMQTSGLHFTREVMDEQLQKWRDLSDQARGWGTTASEAVSAVVDTIKILDTAWVTNADIAEATLSRTTTMVRTLAGELISLQEQQKRQTSGGSFDVDSSNFDATIAYYQKYNGRQFRDPYSLAKLGYSFEEVVKFAFSEYNQGPLPPPQGPRIPGFAAGGMVMVGEKGPEVVRLPVGAQVFPTGTGPAGFGGGGVTNITNNYYVNGTAEEAARKIGAIIMRDLKQIRQFGSA